MSELSNAGRQFLNQLSDIESKRSNRLHKIKERILMSENERSIAVHQAIEKFKEGQRMQLEAMMEINALEDTTSRQLTEVTTDIQTEMKLLEAPVVKLQTAAS